MTKQQNRNFLPDPPEMTTMPFVEEPQANSALSRQARFRGDMLRLQKQRCISS